MGLDGDDTLWHNERLFSMTEERFRSLVAPFAGGTDLSSSLLETERRNLRLFGYGVKSFTLSMIETAIEVTGGRVPVGVIGELVEAGKQMLDHPVELLDGVAETVASLAGTWTLILITKGDLFHQESKLARSGLLPHLDRVEIVSEKEPSTYRRILDAAAVEPVGEPGVAARAGGQRAIRRGRSGGRSAGDPAPAGVGVEVVGDLAHHGVDDEATLAEHTRGDLGQGGQHALALIGLGRRPVTAPHDHRDVARVAVGHPAQLVLVVPARHARRVAQLAPVHDAHRSRASRISATCAPSSSADAPSR